MYPVKSVSIRFRLRERQSSSKQVHVDWTQIPTLKELTYDHYVQSVEAERLGGREPLFTLAQAEIKPGDYFEHQTNVVNDVKRMYSDCGFDTEVIRQDPFSHNCPTVACPIGFPSNLRKQYKELRRYNKWICRIHVEIVRSEDGSKLLSVPHIEVDPRFHALDHLKDTFISGNVVRGPVAVEVLKVFGVQ